MRYNFDLRATEPEPGRSLTHRRDEVEWVPLQNHPDFSSSPVHDSTAARAPRSLLAWDGASRLYFWDSDKLCLHRISILLGEPDPTSVTADSPSKVYFELEHHGPILKRIIDDQHARLDDAQQRLSQVEEKQSKLEDRIDSAIQMHNLLEEHLKRLRHLPGPHKKPLSRAEREFKSELGVELDELRSSINAVTAEKAHRIAEKQCIKPTSADSKEERSCARISGLPSEILS